MQSFPIPPYVDPAVLQPGAHVRAQLGDAEVELIVLRVEPAIICRPVGQPEGYGSELVLLAHMTAAVPESEQLSGRIIPIRPEDHP